MPRLEAADDSAGDKSGANCRLYAGVAYNIGKGAYVRGLYGVFLTNEDFWSKKAPNPKDAGDPMHYVEVQFGYGFR